MTKLTPPLKWHGGKSYLAKKIIGLMPPRCKNPNAPEASDPGWLHFVEPYAGGLSVLLANDPTGISEVVNDANKDLTAFWQTLMNPEMFDVFLRHVQAIPFSEELYGNASEVTEGQAMTIPERAVAFFIHCRQSLAGRMKSFAPLSRNRTRQGMNEQAAAWLTAVEGLPAVHERLKRVVVLNRDALEVIKQQDGPRTLFYLDPPYLQKTRTAKDVYKHEMTRYQHKDLLNLLGGIKGRFLLSGYRSDLYDEFAVYCHWDRHDFVIDNKAASGTTKRKMTECVWTNF